MAIAGEATDDAYRVRAYNTARQSENKMHSDDVAARYGFRGGLVPGVDVFAYMTHPVVARWGEAWLIDGNIHARFLKPVYDGEEAIVSAVPQPDGSLDLKVESLGVLCAVGSAAPPGNAGAPPSLDDFPTAPLPAAKPPASPAALRPGTVLGTWQQTFSSADAVSYLADIREPLPIYRSERIAHPAQLLRMGNMVLRENVRLGPWIHVESEARYFGLLRDGETMQARARVLEATERKGHKFVTLDVVAVGNDSRPVMRARHVAIYEPRTGPA